MPRNARPRAASLLNMPNGMLRSQHKKNMAGENYIVGQNYKPSVPVRRRSASGIGLRQK